VDGEAEARVGPARRGRPLFAGYSPVLHRFVNCTDHTRQVTNNCLQHWTDRILRILAGVSGPTAVLTLALGTGGCASSRPTAIIVQPPAAALPTGNQKQAVSVRLVTYNIWGLPLWMTGARSGRYQQIAKELARLDPDIILLQEAWTKAARKSIPTEGHWSIARAAGQHTFFQQNGLVTLSRFPIVGGRFYPFSRAAYPDKFVNKGVLKVTVRLPNRSLVNIWNVHLQDGGAPEIRISQAHELEAHVLAAEDGQTADLVGGDFNSIPDSAIYRELQSNIGPSISQLSGEHPFVTWDGLSSNPGAGQTVDHIFVRQSANCQLAGANQDRAFEAKTPAQRLSDHFGIAAELTLNRVDNLAGDNALEFHQTTLPMANVGGKGWSSPPTLPSRAPVATAAGVLAGPSLTDRN